MSSLVIPISEIKQDGITTFVAQPSDGGCVQLSNSAIKTRIRERQVEVGCFHKIKPIHVICYHERFPIWLLLFDALDCVSIVIVGVTDWKEFEARCIKKGGCTVKFYNFKISSVGHEKFRFINCQHEVSQLDKSWLRILSGTFEFVSSILKQVPVTAPVVYILDACFEGRLRKGQPSGTSDFVLKWFRLQHILLGGPTDFVTLIGTRGLKIEITTSKLRRSIRDIFNAGIKPTCIHKHNGLLTSETYSLDDILQHKRLDVDVVHPTHFCTSGVGRRPLSLSELGAAYGYPRNYHSFLETWVFANPPYQVLLEVFQAAAAHLTKSPVSDSMMVKSDTSFTPTLDTITQKGKSESTWIPVLSRWLSHSWSATSQITPTVSKNDDAAVSVHLWDNRILLLFPKAVQLLPLLRDLCLRRCRRNVLRDFLRYLRQRFGTQWPSIAQYHRVRCSTSLIGGEVCYLSNLDRLDQRTGDDRVHTNTDDTTWDDVTIKCTNTSRKIKSDKPSADQSILIDISKGVEAIEKLCNASWWEWSKGSSLFYWRWNEHEVNMARDGMTPFIQGDLPNWKPKKTKKVHEPKCSLIAKKLKTISDRNYIIPGKVLSWTDFFDVPKGDEDIRLVYNGTSCGLNQALWVPNFWLPFPRSATRLLDFNYYSGDIDLGEMFHNFPLHETLQLYSGIDLTGFKNELGLDSEAAKSYRWTRTWMGARSSPYSSVRFYYFAEVFIRGNHLDEHNEMRWDEILLNLPGEKNYNPSRPRVCKWDSIKKRIAGDLVTFVDDGRATVEDMEHAWAVLRQVTSRIQYRGIQGALRKIKAPRRNPGPWAGALFKTTEDSITKSVTVEKWDKAKGLIESLWKQLTVPEWEEIDMSYKELEITRGFLCHLSMTFDIIVPYLKGFHLTLASHLNKQDKEGWKHSDKAWKIYLDHKMSEGVLNSDEADRMREGTPYSYVSPEKIKPVKQLKNDVYAIREFLSSPEPPKIFERSKRIQIVRYGFGDASGSGFGSTIETQTGLKYRIGTWGSDDDNESSNFKELENVVATIEEEAKSGNLKESVLFFFTDNATVEAALHKGNSSSKKLFLLVVRFRKVQFCFGVNVVVSHVSGKRMIEQGTDGVSRGNLHEGVGTGIDMLAFIPLHLSALDRHSSLRNWLGSWIGPEMEVLQPCNWFTRGHDHDGGANDARGFWRVKIKQGIFVWAPPPGAAEVALEELRKALIKRQDSTHIFVCPRLLTTEWAKQLHKVSDLVLSVPAGGDDEAWPLAMHEPLTIGFVFPLLHCNPWQRKSTPQMFYMERELSKVFKREGVASRDILCKFFQKQRNLSSMSELLVRRVLYLRK